jgi:hypothetical protein
MSNYNFSILRKWSRFVAHTLLISFFCLNIAGGAEVADVNKRTAVAVVLSWYSSLGASNGRVGWKKGGFAYSAVYEGRPVNWTGSLHNAPLLAKKLLNSKSPSANSSDYFSAVRKTASSELVLLKEAGFDVFAFDMLPRPGFDANKTISIENEPFVFFNEFLIWLDEAEKIGMKGCIFADVWNMSGDFPSKRKLSPDEWVSNLSGALPAVKNHPAYWIKDSRPVVFHFSTDKRMRASPDPEADSIDGGWRKIIQRLEERGLNPYFVADVRRPDLDGESWLSWAGAMYMFTPSSPRRYQAEYQRSVSDKYKSRFFFSVSPGYYRPKVGFSAPTFERIHNAYKEAVASKSEVLVWLTWNDFEEETDIVPSLRKGHALYDIVTCYNRWFKTGVIDCGDYVAFSYVNKVPDIQLTPSPKFWGGNPFWSEQETKGDIYYWVSSSSSGKVLMCGSKSIDLKKGIQFGSIPRSFSGPDQCEYEGDEFSFGKYERVDKEGDGFGSIGLRYFYQSKNY